MTNNPAAALNEPLMAASGGGRSPWKPDRTTILAGRFWSEGASLAAPIELAGPSAEAMATAQAVEMTDCPGDLAPDRLPTPPKLSSDIVK